MNPADSPTNSERVIASCKDLWRSGRREAALASAYAEVNRFRSSRVLYMMARMLFAEGDARAEQAFRDASHHAEREGNVAIATTARIAASECLRTRGAFREALAEAEAIDPLLLSRVSPDVRRSFAEILLDSPSRFVRATAIGVLDDLVTRESEPVRTSALRVAARHVDRLGASLSPLEADRLEAMFSRDTVAAAAGRAREALRLVLRVYHAPNERALDAALADEESFDPSLVPVHRRARDLRGGRFQPRDGAFPSHFYRDFRSESSRSSSWPHAALVDALLDVAFALRDEAWPYAATGLEALALHLPSEGTLPSLGWDVLERALRVPNPDVSSAARHFAVTRTYELERGPSRPSRGFLPLARALVLGLDPASDDVNALVEVVLRRAVLAREPESNDDLVRFLTRSARALAERGERASAIEKLREARTLAAPDPPDPERRAPSALLI